MLYNQIVAVYSLSHIETYKFTPWAESGIFNLLKPSGNFTYDQV
jgi:hypothetical protein